MDLDKLLMKRAFLKKLAFKIGVEKTTLENYLLTDRVPEKHKEIINKAYLLQVEFDEKVRGMEVIMWEKL